MQELELKTTGCGAGQCGAGEDDIAIESIVPGSSTHPENSYAAQKNVAEGLMDIALLSANANQLRFLITYNYDSPTYYLSLGLVIISLILQVVVGIVLLFRKRRPKCQRNNTNKCLVAAVFLITVFNVLLAAFTTTNTVTTHNKKGTYGN